MDILLQKLEASRPVSLTEILHFFKSYALVENVQFFDLGTERIGDSDFNRFVAIVDANIGQDKYDTVSIYEIRRYYDSSSDTYHFKTMLVARHIIESEPGGGRIEDVYYEVTAENYLTRVVVDAIACEYIVDKIFDQQGNYFCSTRANIDLAFDDIFGISEEDQN